MKKHRPRIDDLENKGLMDRSERTAGKRTITFYRPTEKGLEFCRTILEPYKKMLPQKAGSWYIW